MHIIENNSRPAPGAQAVDPVQVAIDKYWNAIQAWRVTDRRVKSLRKRLPAELMRLPGVQLGVLLKRDAKTGGEIREPIYAHNDWQIGEKIRRDRDHFLAMSPLPKRRNNSKLWRSQVASRRAIRTQLKEKESRLIVQLEADQTTLFAKQREAGWRQAIEAERKEHSRVSNLRYRVVYTKPTTIAGALALIEFIYDAQRTYVNSRIENAPYGLGNFYPARICQNVTEFLKDIPKDGARILRFAVGSRGVS